MASSSSWGVRRRWKRQRTTSGKSISRRECHRARDRQRQRQSLAKLWNNRKKEERANLSTTMLASPFRRFHTNTIYKNTILLNCSSSLLILCTGGNHVYRLEWHWNYALWLVNTHHMNCNIQSQCLISKYSTYYSTLKNCVRLALALHFQYTLYSEATFPSSTSSLLFMKPAREHTSWNSMLDVIVGNRTRAQRGNICT